MEAVAVRNLLAPATGALNCGSGSTLRVPELPCCVQRRMTMYLGTGLTLYTAVGGPLSLPVKDIQPPEGLPDNTHLYPTTCPHLNRIETTCKPLSAIPDFALLLVQAIT